MVFFADATPDDAQGWDDDADEMEGEEEDGSEHALPQALIDRLVASWYAGVCDTTALQDLQESVDFEAGALWEDDRFTDLGLWLDPQVLRQAFGGDGRHAPASVLEYCRAMFDDGDVSAHYFAMELTASDERTLALPIAIQGYSFSGVSAQWEGLAASRDSVLARFEQEHWLNSDDDDATLRIKVVALGICCDGSPAA